MNDFEKSVALAAISANPAPNPLQLIQNVLEKMPDPKIDDLAGKVPATLTGLVNGEVLISESTTVPGGYNTGTWGSQPWGTPGLPTFFAYTKGPKWED